MYALPVTAATTTLLLSDWRGTGQFVSAAALNAFITDGLKRLIPKDRPDGSDTKSFPSGHTSVASQGASFIHFRYGLRYGAPAYAVGAFVGYSRVRADKHYWEDVAVGAIIGVGSSWLLTDRRTFDIAGSSLERVDIGLRVTFGNGLPLRLGG
jgi:membrane-associated phospholipid phosphatase